MGRPKKKPGDERGKLMQVRLQDKEHERFCKAAQASGLDLSSWVRERLVKAAVRELKDR